MDNKHCTIIYLKYSQKFPILPLFNFTFLYFFLNFKSESRGQRENANGAATNRVQLQQILRRASEVGAPQRSHWMHGARCGPWKGWNEVPQGWRGTRGGRGTDGVVTLIQFAMALHFARAPFSKGDAAEIGLNATRKYSRHMLVNSK